MKTPKVLLLQNEISAYNVEVYNSLSDKYELTVGYFEKDKSKGPCAFAKHFFRSRPVGPFIFLSGVRQYAKGFDVVCILPNIRIPSYWLLPFLPHRYKLLNWSIGFRVSYTNPYMVTRKHNMMDWLFKKILSNCDASIFYMEKAKEFWGNAPFLNHVFVAPNTTSVSKMEFRPDMKKKILFVGTLYKGKGVDLLISAFKESIDKTGKNCFLDIVGNGDQRPILEQMAKEKGIADKVRFCGAIYDEEKLKLHFQQALLCVSPTQGGLSVPKSMGYGVPFVTRKDAITGGEIYHIHDGEDGILYNSDEELPEILSDAITSPLKYVEMGRKAKLYYENNATVEIRAKGVSQAIEYVLR